MLIDKDKQSFLDKCLMILDVYGYASDSLPILGREVSGKLYEDLLIKIVKSDDDQYMEMCRKTSDSSFFYLFEGSCILFHGEYVYLEQYINKLVSEFDNGK